MEPDVRHLRLVVAVADAGSLSAAARALGVAQPSVSNQLRRIEESLGGDLFERSVHGVRPTERGRRVLRRARRILDHVDLITGAGGPARAPDALRVRTFVLPFELMLPLMQHFIPGTEWEVVAGGSQEGLAAVAAGEADLYYGLRSDDRPPPGGVVVEELLHEPAWVLLPAAHPLAKEPTVDLARLASDVWVVRPEQEIDDAVRRSCRRAGFEPLVRYRVSDPASVTSLVASGAAVSLVSPVTDVTEAVALRPCSGAQSYAWVVGYRADAVSSSVVDVVRDLVRWGYRHKAEANPELMRTLSAELLAVAFPAPLEPALRATT